MMGILLRNLIVRHTHDKVDRVFSRFLAILNGIDTTDVASVMASHGRGWLAHNDGADESVDEAADLPVSMRRLHLTYKVVTSTLI